MELGIEELPSKEISHYIFDKRRDKEYSKEEQLERYRKIIAYRKAIRKPSKLKGTILINNGVEQKKVNGDLPIPEGWKIGAIKRGAENEQ